jgi:hypothetical protein
VVFDPVLPISIRTASMLGCSPRASIAVRAICTTALFTPPRAMAFSYDYVLWYVPCNYVLYSTLFSFLIADFEAGYTGIIPCHSAKFDF